MKRPTRLDLFIGVAGAFDLGLAIPNHGWIVAAVGAVAMLNLLPIFRFLGHSKHDVLYAMPPEVAHAALEAAEARWREHVAAQAALSNGLPRAPQERREP